MKNFNLEEFGLNSSDSLNRNQLKSILGGKAQDDEHGCNVTCREGWYACCNDHECTCVPNSDTVTCTSGGSGSTYCSLS